MGPPSYMRSVIVRNVVMRRMTVVTVKYTLKQATTTQKRNGGASALSFLTSALDGVGRQRHAPAALPP